MFPCQNRVMAQVGNLFVSRLEGRAATLLVTGVFAVLCFHLSACRSAGVAVGPPAGQRQQIEQTLDALYRSFCFDGGGEADWESMESLFLEGASFVAPIRAGVAPRAVQGDKFIDDFKAWISSSTEGETGLHERIENMRIDVFGNVAHAYVLFEGFVPGEEMASTRGVDSIQLVRHGERWLVASFTTQYASDGLPVPTRFQ